MTQAPPPPRRSAWRRGLGALVIVLLLAAAALLLNRPDGEEPSPPTSGSSSETSSKDDPLEVTESTTLTVPDTQRLESHSFDAEAGSTYLLQYDATTTKPPASQGDAMYFGASLACSGPTDGTLRSVGGTQNARTGEEVSIQSQFLLDIEESGRYACRLLVFSPNAEVAAAGTTAEVDTRWSATRVDAGAIEVSADEHLPRLVATGEEADAFVQGTSSDPARTPELRVLGTVHVTTCTEVEGSSEDGQTWCPEDLVDRSGSDTTITYRLDALGNDGEVCESRDVDVADAEVDRHSHHQIFHLEDRVTIPPDLCGTSVRLVVTVENKGPAPLLVHRASSTLVIIPE